MISLPKLMVIGHARHGKDSTCELLRDDFGFRFVSSSWFCAERCVRGYLEARGIFYSTLNACYEDRANHRAEWHEAIVEFCAADPARLGRMLFSEFDIYCGLRSHIEFMAMKHERLFDVAIWVDRSDHLPPEPYASMKLMREHADIIIDNNGGLAELKFNIHAAYGTIMRGEYVG